MGIKIRNKYVIKNSVLFILQIFLILVNSENAEYIPDTNQDGGPNITVKSFPFHIEFSIEDPSYSITKVDCKSEVQLQYSKPNCIDLEPCSQYIADLQIEYTNSTNNDTNSFKNSITVKTNYTEPKVALLEDYFPTTPYSIYIQWDVKYPNCVGLFKIKATSEDKVYMEIKNDRNNVTLSDLKPCEKYHIEFVTTDIKDKIIEPNLTLIALTDYDEPGSVNSLSFQQKSDKSIQVSWKTPKYTTCIEFYNLKWIKQSCLFDDKPASCNWVRYNVINPKTTEYLIDNLEGCEEYKFVITTNGNEVRSSISDNFISPEQKPGPIANFSITNSAETNVTFNWKEPNENGQCVSIYKIHIIGPLQDISLDTTFKINKRKITFDNLIPCGIYNLSITAISTHLFSDEVKNTITMIHAKPNPIQNPYVKYKYPYEVSMEWQKPNFSELCIDHYRISAWATEDINNTNYQISKETNATSIILKQLASCLSYTVQIIPVISGSEPSFDGNPVQLKFETLATTSKSPQIEDPKSTAHSLTIRARNADEDNFCPILIAKFECSAPGAKINYSEKAVEGETERTFLATLEPLSPFTQYECNIYFLNSAGKSDVYSPRLTTDKFYPEEPIDLKVNIVNNSLHINWNKPIYLNGELVFYKVFIQIVGPQYEIPSHCKSVEKKNIFFEISKSEYEYKDIQPYYRYSVQVAAKNDFGTGKTTNPVTITTKPLISNPVENLKYIRIDGPSISDIYEASILLQWQAPCKANGIIKLFEIEFYGKRNGDKDHNFVRYIISPEISDMSKFIELNETNLLPEYNYTVSVKIESFAVEQKSRPISINFVSPAGIPANVNDTNSGKVDVFSASNPTTSALFKMPLNVFRSNVGQIVYAAVLLSEVGCQKDPELQSGRIDIDKNWPNISSWREVESEYCITQYQTTPERWQPFINSKSFQFKNDDSVNSDINANDIIEYVIGNGNDCNTEKFYCNGKLRPATKYKMILRVFTRNGFADTVALEFKTDEEVKIILILIMVVSILLIAFFFGFIYMWINKRKIWYRQSLNGIEDQCGDVTTRNYFLYYNDLSKKDKILREFKELDVVSNDTNSKNIITRYNDTKNRYSNIFPYENNRVILDIDSDGSDYINASFINGYKRKKEYIATQGPKPESFIDFWKMIIQHNVKVIVMLTQLCEGDMIKCHQYFPIMSREMKFGNNITVSCKREVENDIYERRDMVIKHSGDHIYRNIIHYYFKKWPDHDCPTDAMDLITFVKRIKTEKIPSRSPIVVHCSAGVGRTGTFIGLDIIMQRMKNEGKINIYETIKQLRFERMKMVQTLQQYQFLYNCIYQIVLNKYSIDSKKNSIITNNSSTVTIITPPPTPSTTISQQLSPPTFSTQSSTTSSIFKPNCNGNKKLENNSGNLTVANSNKNINDTNSSRNSFLSQNDIESVM